MKCNTCKVEKEIEYFYLRANGKRANSNCKECLKTIRSKEYEENRPHIRAINNKASARFRKTEKYKEGKNKLISSGSKKASDSKYYNKNKLTILAREKEYNRLKVAGTPSWNTALDNFIIEEMYDLARHRTKVMSMSWCVDHIFPVISSTVCGLHTPSNLQVITTKANIAKGRTFFDGDMVHPAQKYAAILEIVDTFAQYLIIMGRGNFANLDDGAIELWQRKTWQDARDMSFWTKFEGGSDGIIEVIDELSKEPGETVITQLVHDLRGDGRVNYGSLAA